MDINLPDINEVPAPADDRVDAREKVTGSAKYAAEHPLSNITYGVLVASTIAKGKIKSLDTKAAQNAPGVIAVISHLNTIKVPGFEPADKAANPRAQNWNGLKVFYDNTVYSNGQPIAVVVADTFERAVYAASLVKAQYDKEIHETDFIKNLPKAASPQSTPNLSRHTIPWNFTASLPPGKLMIRSRYLPKHKASRIHSAL